MYRVNRVLIVFLAAVGLIACRPDLNSETDENHTYQYQIPAELGDGWKTASLEAVGCDSQAIIAMMEDIQGGGYDNLHSILIVKDGRLAFEEYFRGYNPSRIGDVASVTKSVTAIMVGIAMDQGLIESPDQSLSELLPAYKELIQGDERKAKLKLHHLLSMTSGIEWDEETYPYGHYRNDAPAWRKLKIQFDSFSAARSYVSQGRSSNTVEPIRCCCLPSCKKQPDWVWSAMPSNICSSRWGYPNTVGNRMRMAIRTPMVGCPYAPGIWPRSGS